MRRVLVLTAILLAVSATTANAQVVVYSNLTNFGGQGFVNGGAGVDPQNAANTITRLVADRIFASFGSTTFQWSFTVNNQNAVPVSARPRVRFYDDDGPGGAPGTLISGFSFNAISFPANGQQVFNTTAAFVIPADGSFWAGITFDNNGGATGATLAQLDLLGQLLLDPPTVGTSDDSYFISSSQGSQFVSNPVGTVQNFAGMPIANFGWEFRAVPEPGSMTLVGMALAGGVWRVRRKKTLAT